jgi:hypothetical protein
MKKPLPGGCCPPLSGQDFLKIRADQAGPVIPTRIIMSPTATISTADTLRSIAVERPTLKWSAWLGSDCFIDFSWVSEYPTNVVNARVLFNYKN